jgi:hypothetical protein
VSRVGSKAGSRVEDSDVTESDKGRVRRSPEAGKALDEKHVWFLMSDAGGGWELASRVRCEATVRTARRPTRRQREIVLDGCQDSIFTQEQTPLPLCWQGKLGAKGSWEGEGLID